MTALGIAPKFTTVVVESHWFYPVVKPVTKTSSFGGQVSIVYVQPHSVESGSLGLNLNHSLANDLKVYLSSLTSISLSVKEGNHCTYYSCCGD